MSSSLPAPGRLTEVLGTEPHGAHAIALAYGELRRLADHQLRRERSDHTLTPTALVHEAWLRLHRHGPATYDDRGHFFGIAARLMRQILVDAATARATRKRGGSARRVTLDASLALFDARGTDILALHHALARLERIDARKAAIVELRFFSGLTIAETANALDLSPATVEREWSIARTLLAVELGP